MSIDPDGLEKIDLQADEQALRAEEKAIIATPKAVEAEAAKTEATVDKSSKQVARHVTDLSRIDEILRSKADEFILPPLPAFSEIESHEEFQEIVAEILDIISRYSQGQADSANYSEDVLRLSASVVFLSSKLSVFQTAAADRTRAVDLAEAKYYIGAKKAAHSEGVTLSDETAKKLSKSYAAGYILEQSNLDTISRYITNIYYSVKDFVEILNSAANRDERANRLPGA